ncbi:protein-glutamine gamma-glutamyltransferase [Bacillus carboniphilus]|uniref:Protein-glutamine gamma-glutamyltransferase n=1 Tax=Bacillus carboniphilus TaxID=86663 RepID=A0ABP3GIH1_9BACI
MIHVTGMPFQPKELNVGNLEQVIAQKMLDSHVLYSYPSKNDLLFELNLRKNIIESARLMNNSEAEFNTFENARCNDNYWKLTSAGGFLLKPNATPSDAILDIYKNSSLYAFECATACIIIFYHAVLKSIGRPLFNYAFQDIYLYSWHADPDLGISTDYSDHFLPGDVVYFNNPDFSPQTPWYRGLNAVLMDDGKYFGHGFSIMTAEEVIDFLNQKRRPDSSEPAYLTRLRTKPSFDRLSGLTTYQRNHADYKKFHFVFHHNECSISFYNYLTYLQKYISS